MTKRLTLACLVLLHFNLSAQINDLLKDNNIVWIGEFTTDFVVEGYKALDTSDYINSVALLKYLNPKPDLFMSADKPLYSKIQNTFENINLILYKEESFLNKKPLSSLPDTIEIRDSLTNEIKGYKVILCTRRAYYDEPRYYRAKQILFYDKKKRDFGLRVLAIGVMIDTRDEEGNVNGLEEYGWLKPNNKSNKKVNLNAPNISLAMRLNTRLNAPNFEKDFKVLKNTVGNIQQTFITDMTRKTSIDLYNPDSYLEKLSKLDREKSLKPFQPSFGLQNMLNDSNTLKILKEETIRRRLLVNSNDAFPDFTGHTPPKNDSLENNVNPNMDDAFPKFTPSINDSLASEVSSNNDGFPDFNQFGGSNYRDSVAFNGIKEIYGLKIIQDWYWDEKLKTISIRLFAVAPLIKMYDYDGNYIYDKPVFFRLND